MEEIIFTYDETKAPVVSCRHVFEGGKLVASYPVYGYLDGVPARDLVRADWDKLSVPLRRAVLAQPFYVATPAAANLPTDEEITPSEAPAPKGKKGKE